MSVTTVFYRLEKHLKEPGCPICRVKEHAAQKYVEFLLWENVTDPSTRKTLFASRGYCPEHTLLLAKTEHQMFHDALGTSILYESLSRFVISELEGWIRASEDAPRFWKKRPAPPRRSRCRICEIAESGERSALASLMEALETEPEIWNERYLASEGLCLPHLYQAIETESTRTPRALRFVIEERLRRLKDDSRAMQEYIRKHIWDYRDEPKTEEEMRAWRKSVSFFSGLSEETFSFEEGK